MSITIGPVAGHCFKGEADLVVRNHATAGKREGYLVTRTRLVDRKAFDYDPRMGWETDRWFEWIEIPEGP